MRRSATRRLGLLGAAVAGLLAGSAAAQGPHGAPAPSKVDIDSPGTYCSGPWEYRLKVTCPGTKSQGTRGELYFGGKPVEEPAPGDYYRTPWGEIEWVGNPIVLWGAHGWFRRTSGKHGGRALDEPWIEAGGPAVLAMVLVETEAPTPGERIDPWIAEELRKQSAKGFRVVRRWFSLGDQAVTIHDTKRYGTLTARVAPARSSETLTVILDGSRSELLCVPRRDGATRLAVCPMGGPLGQMTYCLAFRVARAAPAWPRPLELGPESNGHEVVVRGTREVVIGLPGDRQSGLVWTVKKVQGDSPVSSSVKAWGEPQFTPFVGEQGGPTRRGIFENVLRVTGRGKTYVELEWKRTWQTDKPPEKTYAVTLDVQDAPSSPRAKP